MSSTTYGALHHIIVTPIMFIRSWSNLYLRLLLLSCSCNLGSLIRNLMVYQLFTRLNIATNGSVVEITTSPILIIMYLIIMKRSIARIFPVLFVWWDLIYLICLLLHLNVWSLIQIPPLKIKLFIFFGNKS